MSLKAKLEAVIYAAEEPVTLAQLTFLFAEEALTWKAERQALDLEHARSAESATEALVPADSSVELSDLLTAVEQDAESEVAEIAATEPTVVEAELESGVPAESIPEPVAEPAIDPEADAKRAQRQRERDVREILRGLLDELIAEYASDSRGIEIREIAGGFRMGTKPEIHDAVRSFVKSLKPPMKLSLPALETLAVIAYKQPVTAPEVGEIRGVDSAGVLGSLMSRKLISTAGRKQVIGRPMLYKTTKEFLLRFGLKDLNELPSMEEFEKMAALELSEGESDFTDAASQSGDLFAESETATVPAGDSTDLEDAPEAPEETDPVQAETAVTTPTAEPSQEAAEAQAPVERLDAEEIEAEP
jgi:segregation and condensation protein B